MGTFRTFITARTLLGTAVVEFDTSSVCLSREFSRVYDPDNLRLPSLLAKRSRQRPLFFTECFWIEFRAPKLLIDSANQSIQSALSFAAAFCEISSTAYSADEVTAGYRAIYENHSVVAAFAGSQTGVQQALDDSWSIDCGLWG